MLAETASSVGGSGSVYWTLVGSEPAFGNPDWPCPRKGCQDYIVARTSKNSRSQCGVCDTRKADDPVTCQASYNLNCFCRVACSSCTRPGRSRVRRPSHSRGLGVRPYPSVACSSCTRPGTSRGRRPSVCRKLRFASCCSCSYAQRCNLGNPS